MGVPATGEGGRGAAAVGSGAAPAVAAAPALADEADAAVVYNSTGWAVVDAAASGAASETHMVHSAIVPNTQGDMM